MQSNPKLNQVIAIEKGAKAENSSTITKLHRFSDNPPLFDGFSKTYRPKDDDGDRFPDESHRVQVRVADVLEAVSKSVGELFDVVATKDYGNTIAKADVKLEDGTILLEGAPTPFLLFLEKQLNDLGTVVGQLPELDEGVEWIPDDDSGLHRSAEIETQKTRKVEEPLVLHPPTAEHPAQTKAVTRDVVIGYWTTTKLSGAMPATKKKEKLRKIREVQRAVKMAREEANMTDVERKDVGSKILDFIFA